MRTPLVRLNLNIHYVDGRLIIYFHTFLVVKCTLSVIYTFNLVILYIHFKHANDLFCTNLIEKQKKCNGKFFIQYFGRKYSKIFTVHFVHLITYSTEKFKNNTIK